MVSQKRSGQTEDSLASVVSDRRVVAQACATPFRGPKFQVGVNFRVIKQPTAQAVDRKPR